MDSRFDLIAKFVMKKEKRKTKKMSKYFNNVKKDKKIIESIKDPFEKYKKVDKFNEHFYKHLK